MAWDAVISPYVPAAVQEMEGTIREHVPEYARPPESPYAQRMRRTITQTVECFGRPDFDASGLQRLYAELGAHEAGKGRSLDALQTAIRVGGRVACQRLAKDAYRLGWPRETLTLLIGELFQLMDLISTAAGDGYARAAGRTATERERHRARLRDLLVKDPPASRVALAQVAAEAGWDLPRTVGVVALLRAPGPVAPVLPPVVLVRWAEPDPYLVVPDPDGPGQGRLLAALARLGAAALGPTVPLERGAVSWRWARQAARLIGRGVLRDDRMIRCDDELVTLLASAGEDLVGTAATRLLRPLMELPERKRETLLRTLDVYLRNGGNAAQTADRLTVHENTVRDRIRRLEDLSGPFDPEQRLSLMVVLHAYFGLLNRTAHNAGTDSLSQAVPGISL